MSKQIVGPIEKKSLGTSFHPNQKSKIKNVEFGFVEGFVFDFSGRQTENLFPDDTGPYAHRKKKTFLLYNLFTPWTIDGQ